MRFQSLKLLLAATVSFLSMTSAVTATTVYLYPDADTFVSSNDPDNNYGWNDAIWVGKPSSGGMKEARIRFSGIPAGATINSAALRLYRYTGVGAFTLAIQSASRSWSENTLTWNTEGSTNRWSTPKSTYYMSGTTGYLSVDVTTHVQEWANGTRSNYGFHLSVNNQWEVNPGNESAFYSREVSSTSDKPRLEIDYTASSNADLALLNLTVSPSMVTTRAFTACSFDIQNNGPTALSSEYINVDYYLSNDTTFGDADDVKIGDTGHTVSISSGATYSISLSPTGLGNMVRFWPADQSGGNYYVFARVTITDPPPTDNNSGNNHDRTDSTIYYNPYVDRIEINDDVWLNGSQRTSLTIGGGEPVNGRFDCTLYNSATNVHKVVVGLRNSSGQWVGGEPLIVISTVPSQSGTALGDRTFGNIATPTTQGTYYLWAQDVLTTSDATAISQFKNSTPPSEDNLNKRFATVTVSILKPVVSIVASDADAGEPANNGYFTVTRTGSTTGSLGVYYGTSGSTATSGSDYTALPGYVDIPANQTTAVISVTVINDSTQESTETVILTLTSNAAYTIGSPSSATVTIADDDGAKLNGLVIKLDAQGQAAGPLAGATVAISGVGTKTSDTGGNFQFANLNPDTYTVAVSKAGYRSVTRSVTIKARETKQETFNLSIETVSESPTAYNVDSPNGKHLIEGMPGNLSFSTMVAWNGSPGSVYFTVAGNRYTATVINVGGGIARATLTLPAPNAISGCSELTIEVVNGEGQRTYVNTGIHFYPVPGIMVPWYRDNIPWTPSGLSLFYAEEKAWGFDLPLGGSDLWLNAFIGHRDELKYDLLAGAFVGSKGGYGKFGFEWEVSEVEILGEGRADMTGTLGVSFAGCKPPVVTPAWDVSFTGRAGLGAPVVLVVDVIFPPAAPAVHWLLTVPVVKDVVGALKVRLFVIGGLALSGEYEGGQWGDCFLGTTSVGTSGTLGLEAQALLELWGAEAGLYAGGTGTPEFQICPDLKFQAITFRAYVGVFASAWIFEFSQEVGAEVRFDAGGKTMVLDVAELPGTLAIGSWQPIGSGLSRYGEVSKVSYSRPIKLMNEDAGSEGGAFVQETIVENVIKVANPSVLTDGSETFVLFGLFDTEKPWYEATDIGVVQQHNTGPWSLGRITDDSAAEFSAKVTPVDSDNALATWERISGDVSDAGGPEDVLPHLEVAASWLDRDTGLWSAPVELTDNSIVDREPLPVVFGREQGILWIQNQADASPGNTSHGDRLMFAEWLGTTWSEPNTLWSAQKGIVGVAFTADAAGKGHIVFAVDEDGDPNSRADREIYRLSMVDGVWQPAIRLTNSVVEDTLPVLVAPNGSATCVWDVNGILTYTPLADWNPKVVYTEHTLANQAPCLDGITMPGGAAVAYTVQTESGIDIFASFYDAGLDRWSLPRRLTNDEHAESALSLTCDGANLVVAFLKTQTERNDIDIEIGGEIQHLKGIPQPGRTDLCLLRHTLGNDLAASSIIIEPSNPAPASAATVTATIENRGDIPLQGAEVTFYDGEPNNGGIIIGNKQVISETLIAGGTKTLSVIWDVPTDVNSHELFVVADPCMTIDDRDRSNNMESMQTVLPDLSIESCRSTDVSGTTVALTARLINTGVVPAGAFEIGWRLGSVDGEQIGTSIIESLDPEESYEVTHIWNMAGQIFSDEYIHVFAVADPTDAVSEFDEDNNLYSMTVVCKTVHVSISVEHIGYDRQTEQFGVDITITNASATAIGAPLWLVIESITPPSVTLADSDGITADSKPYIDLSELLGDGQLDPGENTTMRIYFNNPEDVRFTFEPSVRSVIIEPDQGAGFGDLASLSGHWLGNDPSLDVAPAGGDGIVNFLDFALAAEHWLEEKE